MMGFKKDDFEPHVGTTFEVTPIGMDPVDVELVEVKESCYASMTGFSLMFKGAVDRVFRHNTHLMRHPEMGEMEIFLGPVHTGKTDAVYYQAIFSAPQEV